MEVAVNLVEKWLSDWAAHRAVMMPTRLISVMWGDGSPPGGADRRR